MKPELVDEYQARLTLPSSTHTITTNDLSQLQNQVRAACKSEGVQVSFETGDATIQLIDDQKHNIGNIHTYQVAPNLSVSNLVNWRKQAQKAA